MATCAPPTWRSLSVAISPQQCAGGDVCWCAAPAEVKVSPHVTNYLIVIGIAFHVAFLVSLSENSHVLVTSFEYNRVGGLHTRTVIEL